MGYWVITWVIDSTISDYGNVVIYPLCLDVEPNLVTLKSLESGAQLIWAFLQVSSVSLISGALILLIPMHIMISWVGI